MSTLAETLAKHEITVAAEFVPLSKSRNAKTVDDRGNPVLSLNWLVTIKRAGRDVITSDYMAGMAHCPSYNRKPPAAFDRPVRFWQQAVCAWECENGFQAELKSYSRDFTRKQKPRSAGEIEGGKPREFFPIVPDTESVVACFVLDSSVLDYPTYEEWAGDLGYDPDSRKGEAIYRACLEIALRMRAGLGETVMADLREAAQDF